ncbi:hypothetical protein [Blastopirellula retiformator]|uniref:Uncharacterized protein n=1 Tax=Blastopirellula retiformator TaxID=2527970 RepID=A0A5C5UYJ3_9BACT|nr:hypothetical protein [Blastopirellula retiformator]TWT30713.1 hypothetical protein Enr8_42360 [Blastopirellula retiformator]
MVKSQTEVVADLLARRDAILTELAAMATSDVGALPNTSGPGDHIDHVGYKKSLYDELKQISDTLELIQGPAESISRGRLT